MAIFKLTFSKEVRMETEIFVEADDESLINENIDTIEDSIDSSDGWQVRDGDGYELFAVRALTPAQVAKYIGGGPFIHRDHHFHYGDAEPETVMVDSRQLALNLGGAVMTEEEY